MSSSYVYYKLFRKDRKHYNREYTVGFNEEEEESIGIVNLKEETQGDNPWSSSDVPIFTRGISFSTRHVVWKWLDLYHDIYWIAEVRVAPTSTVLDLGGGHYLTDKCYLSNFTSIASFLSSASAEERNRVISACISGFTYIPNPSEKECLDAVFRFGHLLQFIHPSNITQEICNVAVNSNPWAYQFVPTYFRSDHLKKFVPEGIQRTLQGI